MPPATSAASRALEAGWKGGYHASKRGHQKACSLISPLRPRHLVIREAAVFQPISPLAVLPTKLLTKVREYTCVLDVNRPSLDLVEANFNFYHARAKTIVFNAVPANVQQVTFIFWTPSPTKQWQLNKEIALLAALRRHYSPGHVFVEELIDRKAGGIFSAIARVKFSIAGRVTIVGLNGISLGLGGSQSDIDENMQEGVESEVRKYSDGMMQGELEGKQEGGH